MPYSGMSFLAAVETVQCWSWPWCRGSVGGVAVTAVSETQAVWCFLYPPTQKDPPQGSWLLGRGQGSGVRGHGLIGLSYRGAHFKNVEREAGSQLEITRDALSGLIRLGESV